MWQHRFGQQTDIPAEQIWPVLADVARWPDVDRNIDRITISQTPAPGVPFKLKPKGGPTLSFVIGDFDPPTTYSDICKMPFARMKTLHQLMPGPITTICVMIEITGPLSGLWGMLVGRKHASGLPAQTARILEAACRVSRSAA